MRPSQTFLLILALVLCFAFGWAHMRLLRSMRSPTPHSWPMLAPERLAIEGVEARYRSYEDALAPVTTDASMRRAIVGYLAPRIRAADAADREVLDGVRRRLGLTPEVAVVASIDPVSGAAEWVAPVTSVQ